MLKSLHLLRNTAALIFLFIAAIFANNVWADPSGRVGYVSDVQGYVSYSPAGEDRWLDIVRNRPLIRGDQLWSDRDSRVEFQVGSSAIRLSSDTSVELLDLDDDIVQLRLTQGSVNVRVRRLYRGQTIEVATPMLAFSINRKGSYRIDVDPVDGLTTVTVWEGAGTAYGDNASFPIRAGDAVAFYDVSLRDYEIYGLGGEDDFDQYAFDRDRRLDRSESLRYIDDDVVGYAELDLYGSWSSNRTYGNVWYPRQVRHGWAPYSDGHWVWQEPWGWTWVDHAPWGFAPSHYGRWVSVHGRWGWVPGPRRVRPVYAPALVGFMGGRNWSLSLSLGGGSSAVGWFPLGPREVYVPSYHASREYFTRVNVNNTVINNTTIINNVYNNYSSGDINVNQTNYINSNVANAVTAVPSNVFVNAQPVRQGALRLDNKAFQNVEVTRVAAIAPREQSVIGTGKKAKSHPKREMLDRHVVAHNAPPPAAVPFAKREKLLQKQPGRALEPAAVETVRNDQDKHANIVRVAGDQQQPVDIRAKDAGRKTKAGKPEPLDRSSIAKHDTKRVRSAEMLDAAKTQGRQQEKAPKDQPNVQQQEPTQKRKSDGDQKAIKPQQRKADSDKQAVEQQRKANSDKQAAEQRQRKANSDKQAAEQDQQQQRKANSDKQAAEQQQRKADSDKQAAQQAQQQQRKANNDKQAAEQQQRKADSDKRAAEQQQRKADSDKQAAEQQQRNTDREKQSAQQAQQQQRKVDSDRQAAEQQQRKADSDKQAAQQAQQQQRKADSDRQAAEQQQRKADTDKRAAEQQQRQADSDRQAAQQQQRKADNDRQAAEQQQRKADSTRPPAQQPDIQQGKDANDQPGERVEQHQGKPRQAKSKNQAECEREARKQNLDVSVCQEIQ